MRTEAIAKATRLSESEMGFRFGRYAVGIGVDVHDRGLAEEKLREYEKAVEGVDERITVVDRQYRYGCESQAFEHAWDDKGASIGPSRQGVLHDVFDDIKKKLDECFRQHRSIRDQTPSASIV